MQSTLLIFGVVIASLEALALESIVLSEKRPSILNARIDSRIIGGHPISIKEAPWTVQLLYHKQAFCGGSVISISKILSAAHCTIGLDRNNLEVHAGSSKSKVRGQVRKVSTCIEHPRYNRNAVVNDISIICLTQPLKLTSQVAVIKIHEQTLLPEGTIVLATGWGKTCESCSTSKSLRAVKVPIIGNELCKQMYRQYENNFKVVSSMMCAGLRFGGKDTCQGDSGGPIVFNKTLVGIVSFGIGCAQPNSPGVYTRVASFRKWITKYMRL